MQISAPPADGATSESGAPEAVRSVTMPGGRAVGRGSFRAGIAGLQPKKRKHEPRGDGGLNDLRADGGAEVHGGESEVGVEMDASEGAGEDAGDGGSMGCDEVKVGEHEVNSDAWRDEGVVDGRHDVNRVGGSEEGSVVAHAQAMASAPATDTGAREDGEADGEDREAAGGASETDPLAHCRKRKRKSGSIGQAGCAGDGGRGPGMQQGFQVTVKSLGAVKAFVSPRRESLETDDGRGSRGGGYGVAAPAGGGGLEEEQDASGGDGSDVLGGEVERWGGRGGRGGLGYQGAREGETSDERQVRQRKLRLQRHLLVQVSCTSLKPYTPVCLCARMFCSCACTCVCVVCVCARAPPSVCPSACACVVLKLEGRLRKRSLMCAGDDEAA